MWYARPDVHESWSFSTNPRIPCSSAIFARSASSIGRLNSAGWVWACMSMAPRRSSRSGRFIEPPGSVLDPRRLQGGVLVEGVQGQVAAEARLLEAAERRGHVHGVHGVHAHRADA